MKHKCAGERRMGSMIQLSQKHIQYVSHVSHPLDPPSMVTTQGSQHKSQQTYGVKSFIAHGCLKNRT